MTCPNYKFPKAFSTQVCIILRELNNMSVWPEWVVLDCVTSPTLVLICHCCICNTANYISWSSATGVKMRLQGSIDSKFYIRALPLWVSRLKQFANMISNVKISDPTLSSAATRCSTYFGVIWPITFVWILWYISRVRGQVWSVEAKSVLLA